MEKKEYIIEFTTEMLGTVTKDPEVYRTYIESKKPADNNEEEYLTVDKIEEKGWTGFRRDENGLFIYEYMVKGFLKYAGNVLKVELGLKNVKSKIDDFVFVFPRKIYMGRMDRAIIEPDGVVERPLRAMTMQGPRVTLARSDYVNAGTRISFELGMLKNKDITWGVIDKLLEHGEFSGLGQFRNGGYGRFVMVR